MPLSGAMTSAPCVFFKSQIGLSALDVSRLAPTVGDYYEFIPAIRPDHVVISMCTPSFSAMILAGAVSAMHWCAAAETR